MQKRASAGESIENRNKDILSRNDFGHWEMDTVRGKQGVSKTCLLVLTERKTRNEIIRKMPDGKARSVVSELDKLEKDLVDSSRSFSKPSRLIMVLSLRTMQA